MKLKPIRLPSFLQRTPEQVAADELAQSLLRASFTRAKSTEAELLIGRGVQLEEIARANIEAMEQLREEGENVSTQGGANLEMLEQEFTKLALGLEMQGRYEEAAEVHPSEREKDRLRKIHAAVERGDAMCECKRARHKDPMSGQDIEISPRRALKTIYSRKHGGTVSLLLCEKCGLLNARPITGQAAEIAAATDASHRAKRSLQNDGQLLRARGNA